MNNKLIEQEEEEEERRVTFNHVHEEREEYGAEEPLDESVHQQLADEHQLTPEQRVQEDPNVSLIFCSYIYILRVLNSF